MPKEKADTEVQPEKKSLVHHFVFDDTGTSYNTPEERDEAMNSRTVKTSKQKSKVTTVPYGSQ